jgi:catechol 2,3-dioxygenase-like lactoylglutathione lyase family enzyme
MPLTHTRLLVANFTQCYRFYRDVLELRPNWGDEDGSYASFTQDADKNVVLALFQRQSMSAVLGTGTLPLDSIGQDRFMLIFKVEDVDAAATRIQRLGVKLELEPTSYPDWGYRGAHLRDPDGNLIEIFTGIPPEQWSAGLREANEKWPS